MPHISYAGVPLLLEDPGYEFQVWLERALSLQDLTLFGVEPWDVYQGRNRPRGPFVGQEFMVSGESETVTLPSVPFVGLPLPNYSLRRPPRWKINTLWWPTGGTRYSIGLFLIDASGLATIISRVSRTGSNAGLANLVIQEFQNGTAGATMTVPMYLLPPRELNSTETGRDGYLLCLVDRRYYWGFKDSGLLEVNSETTWEEVYDHIAEAMEETILYDAIAPGYVRPNPLEVTRRYENAGMMLDAVAHSVGQRIVYGTDGVVRAQDTATATTLNTLNQSLILERGLSAGGRMLQHRQGIYPESVRTVFPVKVDDEFLPDGEVYPRTVDATQEAASAVAQWGYIPGAVKVIHTTAPAIFSSGDSLEDIGNGTATPQNDGAVTMLANAIARDFYGWLAEQYDQSGVGFLPWTPTGFDDYIWWHLGWQERLPYAEGYAESGGVT